MEETEFILGNGEVVPTPITITPTEIEADEGTLLDAILTQKNEIIEKYATNIEWIDRYFDGGFEMGQMVTILGDAEAGKTQLVNQILCNVANNHKCLYFALEFNKRKLIKYFKQKWKNKNVTERALNNIYHITPDMIKDEEITKIIDIMQEKVNKGIKFIVIDSSMMIYRDGMAGEPEISEIFRLLHDFANIRDILLFVITQASKDDNKNNRVAIFGSQRATHLSDIIFYIKVERNENNEIINRKFVIQKNKQEGKYGVVDLYFDRELLLFSENTSKSNTGTGQVKQVKRKSNSEEKKENNTGTGKKEKLDELRLYDEEELF